MDGIPDTNPGRAMWLQQWRLRMGFTVPQAAEALGLSEARLSDNLYQHDRRPSDRTMRLALRLEQKKS